MAVEHDLVIRGGLVYDGDGGAPYLADIAVSGGRISAVGRIDGTAAEEIEATGKVVTPGFIDMHTHYDGQVTWENNLYASSAHGVTTAVMGNCGVGFAPCRAGDRDRLVNLMEGVEDIPEAVMAQGLPWNWETFPEYLDALEKREMDIDFAAQLPHSALRVFVMGQRAVDRETAGPEDLAKIEDLVAEGIASGALGFTTSRYLTHRTADGQLIPSRGADRAELLAIARGLKRAGAGVIEAIVDFDNFEEEFANLKALAGESGRPLSFSLAQVLEAPEVWKRALELTGQANREGMEIRAQVIGRPTGLLLGLDLSYHPFTFHTDYKAIAHLPLAERVARMRRPEVRARILADEPSASELPLLRFLQNFDWIFPLGDPPMYEPAPDASLAAIAQKAGTSVHEVAYDALLQNDGRAILFLPVANYADRNLDAVREMLVDPHSVLGLGDGGAHYGVISDSGFPTFMLSYWARDRADGRLPVEMVVKALSSEPAAAVGLRDRGRIKVGLKGDLNIIDMQRIMLRVPDVQRDLPAGGRRLIQRADGIEATIVSGETILRNGERTGALPGRLVRGARAAAPA